MQWGWEAEPHTKKMLSAGAWGRRGEIPILEGGLWRTTSWMAASSKALRDREDFPGRRGMKGLPGRCSEGSSRPTWRILGPVHWAALGCTEQRGFGV